METWSRIPKELGSFGAFMQIGPRQCSEFVVKHLRNRKCWLLSIQFSVRGQKMEEHTEELSGWLRALACLSSLRLLMFWRGDTATLTWPRHCPLKSVMLYHPHTSWKPDRRGERSTEANPITRSDSGEQGHKAQIHWQESFSGMLKHSPWNMGWKLTRVPEQSCPIQEHYLDYLSYIQLKMSLQNRESPGQGEGLPGEPLRTHTVLWIHRKFTFEAKHQTAELQYVKRKK